jgi:hypothetical protein
MCPDPVAHEGTGGNKKIWVTLGTVPNLTGERRTKTHNKVSPTQLRDGWSGTQYPRELCPRDAISKKFGLRHIGRGGVDIAPMTFGSLALALWVNSAFSFFSFFGVEFWLMFGLDGVVCSGGHNQSFYF